MRRFWGWNTSGPPSWAPDDPRRRTTIEFLIATVPDPVESGLPFMFDRSLSSIQAALQAGNYLPTGRFHLPWQDCLLRRGKSAADGDDSNDETKAGDDKKGVKHKNDSPAEEDDQKQCQKQRPFATEPGVVLFRRVRRRTGESPDANLGGKPAATQTAVSKAVTPAPDKTDDGPELLLLYLVGETPVRGIQKRAMTAALNEVAFFCDWGSKKNTVSESQQEKCQEIRLLGPTFSGSAQSVDFALGSWLNSPANAQTATVRMVSGSATAVNAAIKPDTDFPVIQNYETKKNYEIEKKKDRFFHSMLAPSADSRCALFNYLQSTDPHFDTGKVALLSESTTVYGFTTTPATATTTTTTISCPDETKATSIPFPLHISQLRAAAEEVRQSQLPAAPQLVAPPPGLPLAKALEEVNQAKDSFSPFSPIDPLTSEQIISQLLATISRGRYRYVGITATDIRDTIFLAQEVHEHCPAAVLFAFNPDLLLLHPEVNSGLRGMLLATSYPLMNMNLLWSPPHPPPHRPHVQRQFPDQVSEGVFNATLALLGKNDDSMLEYGLPFELEPTLPPLWITVVGRNRMWPLRAYDTNGIFSSADYMYKVPPKLKLNGAKTKEELLEETKEEEKEKKEEQESWFRGLYPVATLIFMAAGATVCLGFCLPLFKRSRKPGGKATATESWYAESWLEQALAEADSETSRRGGELFLLAASASLLAFSAVATTVCVVPLIVMGRIGALTWNSPSGWLWPGVFAAADCISVLLLLIGVRHVLAGLQSKKGDEGEVHEKLSLAAWAPIAAGSALVVICAGWLSAGWVWQALGQDSRSALFASIRSLDLLSGVSVLVPLFLIFMAGFLWALSFRRVRQMERFESEKGFLCFSGPFLELYSLEDQLRSYLGRASLRLPGATVVVALAVCSIGYLFGLRLVKPLEGNAFYWMIGSSFLAVNLALWCGVLRFYGLWRRMHHLLQHLSLVPLRTAYKRLQHSFPLGHKIDLASPTPTLAALAASVEQAQKLCQWAGDLLEVREIRLLPAVGDEGRRATAEGKSQGTETRLAVVDLRDRPEGETTSATILSADERSALQRLGSEVMAGRVRKAESHLASARQADAAGNWRKVLRCERRSQEALSYVVAEVSLALQEVGWKRVRGASEKAAKASTSRPPEEVFELGEDFLVGRVAHFLAHVMPQMQNLIVTSVSGLLLMLFAVSSYPFQPHNPLLLFNWVVILSFVGIAMWVFIQMNRDPVLSSLNGTQPGRINWDREFIFRILIYGIVPILALLGAQFPQSVGQIVSHFVPSGAMH